MNRRSGLKIMLKLIGLVKPLFHIMAIAIIFGVLGFLCAIFISILSSAAVLKIAGHSEILFGNISIEKLITIIILIAILRGFLHYIEQYSNHFIAFKLLAIIRHKVFRALRKLAPAKLESRDKGNLISVITSDIELLEVFYAHTISPIVIAFITSIIMIIFIAKYSVYAAIFAAAVYFTIGFIIPMINGKRGKKIGMDYRNSFGDLNSFVLESLRGLDEINAFNYNDKRNEILNKKTDELSVKQKKLSNIMSKERVSTSVAILVSSMGMLLLMATLYKNGVVNLESVIIPTFALMGSFGPVVALSSLSNNLNQTLASGERVLSLLEEKPIIDEIADNENRNLEFDGITLDNISFKYDNEKIIDDMTFAIKKGDTVGIYGRSGSGKSTLLKLIMRFWDIDGGELKISDVNIDEIPTSTLRDLESYVTQETHIFQGSIKDNIKISKLDATDEEIVEAAKKAAVHDFISSLPNGYDTKVSELGESLSGGEKQRIGIARAFLHNSPVIFLDEPTSNLDSLNEGIILKSLKEFRDQKTIIIVSHRKSTLGIANKILEVSRD